MTPELDDEHKRINQLTNALTSLLQDYCGETGENEGVVETLQRKLKELAQAQSSLAR